MANIIDAVLRLTDNFTPTLVKAQDSLTKYYAKHNVWERT